MIICPPLIKQTLLALLNRCSHDPRCPAVNFCRAGLAACVRPWQRTCGLDDDALRLLLLAHEALQRLHKVVLDGAAQAAVVQLHPFTAHGLHRLQGGPWRAHTICTPHNDTRAHTSKHTHPCSCAHTQGLLAGAGKACWCSPAVGWHDRGDEGKRRDGPASANYPVARTCAAILRCQSPTF